MKNPLIIIVLCFLLSSVLVQGLDIKHYGDNDFPNEITTWNPGTRHYGFPDVCLMPNGKLLMCYGNGDGHGGEKWMEGTIGTISGDTVSWGSSFTIYHPTDGGAVTKAGNANLHVTPNGTIICAVFYEWDDEVDELRMMHSYDNGTTWNYEGVLDGGAGDIGIMNFKNRNGIVYGLGFQHIPSRNASFWKNTNNGNINDWEVVSWLGDTGNWQYFGEMDFEFINDTHIVAYARCSGAPGGASGNTRNWFFESNDTGLTWGNLQDVHLKTGVMADCDLHWLNEDKGVMILHGRWRPDLTVHDWTAYQVATTPITPETTWYNLTTLMGGGSPNYDTGYTGFTSVGSNYGYLVWYGGISGETPSEIYGVWIYDNTTYAQDYEIEFLDINNEENNTVLVGEEWRWNTWTIPELPDALTTINHYQYQIANDSVFSDVFVNINDVNEANYPTRYTEVGDSVSFKVDDITTYGADYSWHYYRVRTRYKKVTS